MNKFRAQRTRVGDLSFDSKYEAKVYQLLTYRIPPDTIKCHEPIDLNVNSLFGKTNYPIRQRTFRPDFFLTSKEFYYSNELKWVELETHIPLVVEAKGIWQRDDYWKLLALRRAGHIIVVVSENKPSPRWFGKNDTGFVLTLSQLEDLVRSQEMPNLISYLRSVAL